MYQISNLSLLRNVPITSTTTNHTVDICGNNKYTNVESYCDDDNGCINSDTPNQHD